MTATLTAATVGAVTLGAAVVPDSAPKARPLASVSIVQRTTIHSPHPEIADREPVHFTSTIEILGQG